MEKTLLFYDLETSGLNFCFDQPLEFAAVRTDLDLIEVERTHFFIKLRNDVIPSPDAVLVTGFDPLNQNPNALNETEAACKIHELFNTPGTTSIGYNSLGFDDEFLRFTFYRNLLPPYTHQYGDGCGRADMFPIAIIYYLFHNETLLWQAEGREVSLKLEALGNLNGLFTGQAHSALHDTLATLQMARIFKKAQPKTWDYLLSRFNKELDKAEIDKIELDALTRDVSPLAYAVDTRYGYKNNFIGQVLSIGSSNAYKNQTLWLRLDSENLQDTTAGNLAETSMVIRKRLGDIPIILPPYHRYGAKIEPERVQLEQSNLQWLLDHPDIFAEICEYHRNFRYPEAVNVDAEAMLYVEGFITRYDEQWCRSFHKVTPDQKSALLGQLKSPALQELGVRLLGREYYELLSPDVKRRYDEHVNRIFSLDMEPRNDYRNNPRLTVAEALNRIDELIAEGLDDDHEQLIQNLTQMLHQRCKTV